MAQQTPTKQSDTMLPLLATAALGAGGDPGLQALLKELVEDQLAKRRKEKEKAEQLILSNIAALQEEKVSREAQQKHCSHRKQDGDTRLCGQYLSGTGQLSLVCTFCAKNFFHPPNESLGQVAAPRDLLPSADSVGG